MTTFKCMFTHTDCIKSECPLFFNDCAFVELIKMVILNNDAREQRNKFSKIEQLFYKTDTDPFVVMEAIVRGKDMKLSEKEIFVKFLQDNNLEEDDIKDLVEQHSVLIHYLSFYKEAYSNYPTDNKKLRNHFNKKIEQEKEEEERQNFEKLLSYKEKLIEYLKSIKAKKLFKKDIFYFYSKHAKIYLHSLDCDSIIRYIEENGLYP